MAKIKVHHLRKFMREWTEEKITFSKMVEKLNQIAENNGECRNCKKEIGEGSHPVIEIETGLCQACFTSNA